MSLASKRILGLRIPRTTLLSLLVVLPSVAQAAGTTAVAAQVTQFYSSTDSVAWVQLDPTVAVENINNCSSHVGANWFRFDNMNFETGKKSFAMIEMAYAMKEKLRVHVVGTTCTLGGSTGFNIADYIIWNRADNP
ncbi:MAG: hypothetical protein AB7P42_00005 [Gammaproteobacteria bacterium]